MGGRENQGKLIQDRRREDRAHWCAVLESTPTHGVLRVLRLETGDFTVFIISPSAPSPPKLGGAGGCGSVPDSWRVRSCGSSLYSRSFLEGMGGREIKENLSKIGGEKTA